MDNMVKLCESRSLDTSSNADHDLGLTLSPGSQPQLAAPFNDREDVDDLASLFGIDDDFDPFTDFSKLAHPTDETCAPKKRTRDVALEGDIEFFSSKRQLHEDLSASVAGDMIVQPPNNHAISRASIPSVSSNTTLPIPEVPAVITSSTIKSRFALNPESLARIAAVESFAKGKSNLTHISPYAPVGYYPSAPNLHSNGGEPFSNEALRSRLNSSRRRLDVVMAERNNYRDALLKHEQVDPETGMLGIQKLEAENLRLRRTASNHRCQVDKLKAEVKEWKERYTSVATTHNCLIRDYQTLQATTRGRLPALEVPSQAVFASPQDNRQGNYERLSQAFNVLYAAYMRSYPNPSGIKSSVPSPVSPLSMSSPAQTCQAPTANLVQPAGLDTSSQPAHYKDHPTDLPSPHSEDLSPDLPTSPSAQSPPGEPNTMATNYTNSTSSGRRGYVPPISPEQAASLLQRAGIPFNMPTTTVTANMPAVHPVAYHDAAGATMNTKTTTTPVAAVTPTTNEATVPTPTVPPKDIVVIDLTSDTDTEVSLQKSNSEPPAPLTQESSPLTEFRRRLHEKKLSWLHESNNSDADAAVAEATCEGLNSRKRKRELGKDFVGATYSECYRHVQVQKVF